MATTSLRIYLHDIEGMIGAGQTDEAIAHCRHILQTFPKSIAVYRLLGKAYLESQRYSDAADVLQRVLSSVPEDFISHVGMSMIGEDEGNLDTAIWHMERAFETQPYNSAIQGELRRLYGRRDGLEPPKMRLTRGALARLYVKGSLYQQAIGELRAALAEDPQRLDLQALLAHVYFMSGQRVEAVEACSTLLKKIPYCLDANILLSAILPETERAQDAQTYRQRVIAMDPYFSQAASNAQTADYVPANAISIEKLDYSPAKAAAAGEGQPAWATSLGVAFKEQTDEKALPDWLASSTDASKKLPEEPTAGDMTPFKDTEAEGAFPWESPSEEAAPSAAEPTAPDAIPDWMREAGWTPSSGAVQEGPVKFNLEEEAAAPVEGALAPAEIPDWLREAAPPGVLDQPQAPTAEKPAEELFPWLQETPPGPSDTIISWLNSTKSEVSRPAEETPSTLPADLFPQLGAEASEAEIPGWLQTAGSTAQAMPEEELPDWLKTPDAETSAIQADLPDWLKSEAPTPPLAPADILPIETSLSQETPAGSVPVQDGPIETPAPAEEFPAWLKDVEAEIPDEAVEKPQLKGVTEWLATVNTGDLSSTGPIGITDWLDHVEPGQEPHPSEPEAAPADEIPDWLKGIVAAKQTDTVTAAEPELAAEAGEIPEWLRAAGVEERGAAEAEAPEGITPPAEITQAAPAEEIPNWMKEIEAGLPRSTVTEPLSAAEGKPQVEIIPGDITPAFDGGLPPDVDLSDQDATLAWLESLAAKQGAPEAELFTKPEVRTEIPSAWAEEVPEETPAVPADVIPDWMREVAAEEQGAAAPQAYEEIVPTVEVTPAEPVEEIPDWLKVMAAEEQEPTLAEVSEEAAPAEEIPDWLKAMAVEEQEPAVAEIPKEAAPAEEIPDWLRAVAVEEQEPAVTEIPKEAAPAEEIPDWLKAMAVEEQEPAGTEIPEEVSHLAEAVPAESAPSAESELPPDLDLSDQDAAMAWLESLAAKQGAPEAELFTKPEERAEAPSAWTTEIPEETPAVAAEELPDWMREAAAEEQGAAAPQVYEEIVPTVEATPVPPAEEVPDWLKAMAVEEPAVAEIPKEAAPAEEIPDWLKAVAVEEQEPAIAEIPKEAAPAEEIPDWLKAAAVEEQEPAVAEIPQEAAAAAVELAAAAPLAESGLPPDLDLSDQDAAMAWLESLAAKQGVPQTELFTKPEERAEIPSAWAEEVPEETPAAPTEYPSQPTEWIKETDLTQWQETVEAAKPEVQAEPEVELPGWIAEVASQDTELAWVPPQISETEEKVPARTLTDLNTASLGELERLPEIGFVLAQSIINHRDARGPFTRLEDLLDVPGIGSGTIDVLKDRITIQPVAAAIAAEEGAVLLDPDHTILKQAQNTLQQGDIPGAIKQYEKLLKKLVLLNEIVLDLQDALYRHPVEITIWQALGDAYMRNNQLQDALDAYTKAEELLR